MPAIEVDASSKDLVPYGYVPLMVSLKLNESALLRRNIIDSLFSAIGSVHSASPCTYNNHEVKGIVAQSSFSSPKADPHPRI